MKREETVRKIVSGIQKNEMVSVSRTLEVINTFGSGPEKKDVELLAEILSSDDSVSNRILQMARPMRYNPEGKEVETLQQAIDLIGLEKIASVAIAILTDREMESDAADSMMIELLSKSILSGLVARHLAQESGTGDADLAFAAGLLRNFGDVFLARLMPDEYRQACEMAKAGTLNREDVFEELFGISPLDLATEVFSSDVAPDSLNAVFKAISESGHPATGKISDSIPHSGEVQSSAFGFKFGDILTARVLEKRECTNQMESLFNEFKASAESEEVDLYEFLKNIYDDLEELKASGGLSRFAGHLRERVRILAVRSADALPDGPVHKVTFTGQYGGRISESDNISPDSNVDASESRGNDEVSLPNSRIARSQAHFHHGIYSIVNHASEPDFSHEEIIGEICQIAANGYKCRNIYFFAPSGYQDYFISFLSYGPETTDCGTIPSFSVGDGSFLAQSVLSKQPVLLRDVSDEDDRVKALSPWLKGQLKLNPFIAWPLVSRENLLGVVLFTGGSQYACDEFKIASQPMVQFFRFAGLTLASRRAALSLN